MTKTTRSKERDHHKPRKNTYRDVEKKSGEGAHGFGSVADEIEFEKAECLLGHDEGHSRTDSNIPVHVQVSSVIIDHVHTLELSQSRKISLRHCSKAEKRGTKKQNN